MRNCVLEVNAQLITRPTSNRTRNRSDTVTPARSTYSNSRGTEVLERVAAEQSAIAALSNQIRPHTRFRFCKQNNDRVRESEPQLIKKTNCGTDTPLCGILTNGVGGLLRDVLDVGGSCRLL